MKLLLFVAWCWILLMTVVPSMSLADSPKFLTTPFHDPLVKLQQAWYYYPKDTRNHFGFDFIKGVTDQSCSPWQSFDIVAASSGWAMRDRQDEGFGNFVIVKHRETDDNGHNIFTLYAHFEDNGIVPTIPQDNRFSPDYSKWIWVERGEKLGRAGASGFSSCNCTCTHLHFEVFTKSYNDRSSSDYRVDPFDIQNVMTDVGYRYYYPSYFPEGTEYQGMGPHHIWKNGFPSMPSGEKWTMGSVGILEGHGWMDGGGKAFQNSYVGLEMELSYAYTTSFVHRTWDTNVQ